MTVGIFKNGRLSTDLAHKVSPCLSGQRAVKKSILEAMAYLWNPGYGIEAALTVFALKEGIKIREVFLDELTHVMKEEKMGFFKGFTERLKMYWQIYMGFRMARQRVEGN